MRRVGGVVNEAGEVPHSRRVNHHTMAADVEEVGVALALAITRARADSCCAAFLAAGGVPKKRKSIHRKSQERMAEDMAKSCETEGSRPKHRRFRFGRVQSLKKRKSNRRKIQKVGFKSEHSEKTFINLEKKKSQKVVS